jgi:prepilin-type N-terminal cleavage/methylation domain-containing protein
MQSQRASSHSTGRPAQRGFSLVELLVTVALLGILAAIAVPSYRSFVARGQQEEAQTNLTLLAMELEQQRARTGTYCPNGVSCGAGGALGPHTYDPAAQQFTGQPNYLSGFFPKRASDCNAGLRYTYGVRLLAPPPRERFVITADPAGAACVAPNGVFRLDSDGSKFIDGVPGW